MTEKSTIPECDMIVNISDYTNLQFELVGVKQRIEELERLLEKEVKDNSKYSHKGIRKEIWQEFKTTHNL